MEKMGKPTLQNLAETLGSRSKSKDPWARTENLRCTWGNWVCGWKNWVNGWGNLANESCKKSGKNVGNTTTGVRINFSTSEDIIETSKKNRKEHDLVNGWKWTKYGSRMSYGYEIANFKWVPGRENDNYDATMDKSEQWVDGKVVITYANPPAVDDELNVYRIKSGRRYYGAVFLPWTWKTKEEAQQYIDFQSMLANRTNAVNSDTRSWDASTGQELLCPMGLLFVETQNLVGKIEMDMSQMPEELPSSREVFEALMWGNPQEFDAAYALLTTDSKKHWDRPTIENEIEESEGEEVAIAA